VNDGEATTPEDHDHQSTKERLAAATIGGHKPLNSTIYLAPYDPEWPARFVILAGRVRDALGAKALLLQHVGSTSIPGMSAKPIIDMLLVVEDSADELSYVPSLEESGFTLRIREPDWYEHRLLRGSDIKANLHVFSSGCREIERMIAFRDWLREHPEDHRRYEETKRRLAAKTWAYTQDYADAKTDVVEEILGRALPNTGAEATV
jgi:GrpB-like predicted nucleotidyltransferase (UPF0157 family)